MIPGTETAIVKAFEWIWKSFGKDIVKSSTDHLKTPWQKFEYKRAAQRYADDMKRQYGIIQILNMSSPVSLEGIFTNVDVLSRPSAFRRTAKDQLEKIYLGETNFGDAIEKGIDGLEAVHKHLRLFILGKPGSGKTTFLKYITLQAIVGDIDRIPIFVPLRRFSEAGESLFEFISQQFQICDFPEAQPFIKTILEKGKAIILFDGLDEVNKEDGLRDQIIQDFIDFCNEYDESQIIITCRVADADYHFEGVTYVEMADFDKKQIRSFVHKWFESTNNSKEESQRIVNCFFYAFEKTSRERLRELAKTPLLLTLLCMAFEETLDFPARRSEVYEEALDALLKKWDTSRGIRRDEIYHKLSLGRKRQMFTRIAAETFQNREYLFDQSCLAKRCIDYLQNLPPANLPDDFDGVSIIKAIAAQHGIFVERASGIYSFSHLTFQEFYTAKYIVEHVHEGTIERLIDNYSTDTRWREVFLLSAEMLDDANIFFKRFLSKLNNFAIQDEILINLLKRVEKEANEINIEIQPFKVRKAVIYLILETMQNIAKIIAKAGRNEWRAMARENIFEIGSILATDKISDTSSIGLSVKMCNTAGFTALTRTVARTIDRIVDNDIIGARSSYNVALKLIKQKGKGWKKLYKEFRHLSIPSNMPTQKERDIFANKLFTIMYRYRPVEYYHLKKQHAQHIELYLKTMNLLLDCLDVAYVSNRTAIEEDLFRPQKQEGKELKL